MKTYKEYINEEVKSALKIFKTKLAFHLAGGNISDSIENIEIFKNYFNNSIPNELKYEGTLYRLIQTTRKDMYNFCIKTGFNVYPNQKYYACSKTLDGIEYAKQKMLRRRYKYFVIFKFDVTEDDVLFDVNKMIDYIGLDENRFKKEEEVIVLSDKIPYISKNNIVDYGTY